MLNRANAPAYQPIAQIHLQEPEELVFPNGLKMFLFRAPEQQLIRAEFIFNNIYSNPENPMLNTCLCAMLKEGTKQRSSAQVAEEIDFYGAYLMPEYSYDQTSLSLYTLSKHAAKVLPIVKDVLCNSTIPDAELQTYIRNNKQSLQISMQKNDFVARKMFYNNVFGNSRYGITPTVAAYDNITREQLDALYKKQFQPHNCTLILAGNIDDNLINQLKDLFVNDWDSAENVHLAKDFVQVPFLPEFLVEEKPDALQSAIRLGVPTINRVHPDFPAFQFVNCLFGGYFGSRLMRNIREEKGYTYSIGSAIASLKYTGFFTIASEVGAEVTQATLTEIEKEFTILRTELPTEEEVELVRNYMLGTMLGSLESIFSHADKFKSVHFYGLDLAYYQRYNEVIKSMTPEKVQAIALKYFDYDKLIKIVVGKLVQ